MLISIDWIKDFVNVPNLSPKEIGSKFTLATAEVEDIISTGDFLEKIKVVEIVSFEKHPEADKLNLVTFKISDSETRKVVCGAGNVKVGLKVPYAPLGVTLPSGLTLEAKKIRGILSEGMLCSEEELGTKTESEGIFEMPLDTKIGMTMLEFFGASKDVLLDVDNKSLTHRPDLWGHYGMAREFSAIFREPLKNRFTDEWRKNLISKFTNSESPIKVRLEGKSSCISYMGLSVTGISVTESPEWMKRRLKACGLRSINSIVDISNYVMLELGLPLHIFDRDLIEGGEVVIHELSNEAKFITLDEVERNLIPSDTVIGDKNGPLVLAGIMGGKKSGVSDITKNIFIEVANWDAASTRRTSTRLGLRTDSSQRYEKSLDSQLSERTMLRTLEIVLELNPNAKVVGKLEYQGTNLESFSALKIETSVHKINSVLGKNIEQAEIESIFKFLDFKVDNLKGNGLLSITVPSYRSTKDVEYEQDLIEEIGRIVGFDNIIPTSPLDGIKPVKLSEMQKVQRKVRDFLVYQAKSFEVMTYPLIGEQLLKNVSWPNSDVLKLYNSISQDRSVMRPSLIPTFLEALELNSKYQERCRFFELGRSYSPNEKDYFKESYQLGVVFYNKDLSCFIDLENTAINLLNSIGLNFDFVLPNPKFQSTVLPKSWSGVHPVEHRDIRIMGKMLGSLFSVHPIILKNMKIRGHVSVLIVDLSMFNEMGLKDKIKYKPLSKFPQSHFDWTVEVPKNIEVGEVLKVASKIKLKELNNVEVLDLFASSECNYLTLRAQLQAEDATLSSDFLKSAELLLIKATTDAGFSLKK